MKNSIDIIEKISDWPERKNALLYIISISFALKLIFLISESVVNKDGLLYIAAAQKIAGGYFHEALQLYSMPLYPILIAGMHFIIPDWVVAARIISISFIVFTLVPLYLLTKELFDRKAAFWACLAYAVAPVPNGWADSVIRDPGFIFCLAWAVFFALSAIRYERIIFFAAAALFSWISILFRLEGIILIFLIPIYVFAVCLKRKIGISLLLKSAFLWIIFPLLFSAVLMIFLGFDGTISINRNSELIAEARKLFSLEFMHNYHAISERLISLENLSPFPGGMQNFAETARHYIPAIYLLGLIETFILVLFPLFVVPLLWVFKNSSQKNRGFILTLFFAFLFMGYYFLIKEDFIQKRFLSVPALLAYPWAGAGMQRIFIYFSERFSIKAFIAVVLILFIPPVYKCIEHEFNEDRSILAAAEWIKKEVNSTNLKIATTDQRFLYYIGRKFWIKNNPTADKDLYLDECLLADSTSMERIAITHKMDLIVINVSLKRKPPDLKYFKKMAEFKGTKNISSIYLYSDIKAEVTGG